MEIQKNGETHSGFTARATQVKHRAGFDVYDVSPIEHVANLRHSATPTLFVHGKLDNFISHEHSRDLHEAHGGDSTLLLLDVDHQANRPAAALIQACLFVYDRLAPRENTPDDRLRYAAQLEKLAEEGHLGARDEKAAEHASGMSRERQRAVEQAVADKVTGRFKNSFFG